MIELQSGVYCIKNIKLNKVYIGSSKNIHKRFIHHRHYLRNNKHYNKNLQNDWNNQLESEFEFSTLEECSVDTLKKIEDNWIEHFGGLNSLYVYNNEDANRTKRSEESKKRQSEAMMGNKRAEGVVFTEERKRKIGQANSKALKGHKQSIDTKTKRAESLRKYWEDVRAGRIKR